MTIASTQVQSTAVEGWSRPGDGLTDEHMAAARTLAEDHGGADTFAMVVVSGSLAAGLGHSMSDLDLLVTPRPGRSVEYAAHQVGPYSVQFNPMPMDRLDQLTATGSAFVATSSDRDQLRLPEVLRKDLIRLTLARPVLASTETDRLLARLDGTAVRRLIMAIFAVPLGQLAEDCLGAWRSGDHPTVVDASILALRRACDLALAAAGHMYVGEKFLGLRLRSCPPLAPWAPRIWNALHSGPAWGSPKQTVGREVLERLRLAQHLAVHGVLRGWGAELTALPDLYIGRGPRRNPYFVPIRFADAWALAGPDVGLRSTEDLVHIWSLLDGRPIAEIQAAFLQHKGMESSPTRTRALGSALDALIARGAVLAGKRGGGDMPEDPNLDLDLDLDLEEDGACGADAL